MFFGYSLLFFPGETAPHRAFRHDPQIATALDGVEDVGFTFLRILRRFRRCTYTPSDLLKHTFRNATRVGKTAYFPRKNIDY
jgi:hypothetical protein